MRILFFLFLWVPTISSAFEVALTSGEHVSFTRLYLPLPDTASWDLTKTDDGVEVEIAGAEYQLDNAFARITRDRIAQIQARPNGKLVVEFSCGCIAIAFEAETGGLVIDITEKPAELERQSVLPLLLRSSAPLPSLPANMTFRAGTEAASKRATIGLSYGEPIERSASESAPCLAESVLRPARASDFSKGLSDARRKSSGATQESKTELAAYYLLNGFLEEAALQLSEINLHSLPEAVVLLSAIKVVRQPVNIAPDPLACLGVDSFWWLLMSPRDSDALRKSLADLPAFFRLRIAAAHPKLRDTYAADSGVSDAVFDSFVTRELPAFNNAPAPNSVRLAAQQIREILVAKEQSGEPFDPAIAFLAEAFASSRPPDAEIVNWALASHDFLGALRHLGRARARINSHEMHRLCAQLQADAIEDASVLDLLRIQSPNYACGIQMGVTSDVMRKLADMGFQSISETEH